MVRKIGSAVLGTLAAAACGAARDAADVEPRFLAVHNALAATGLAQVGPVQRGTLAEGREARLRLDLGAQCTTIVTLGGAGVRDVDVSLLDVEDKPVAHDTTRDPEAVVRACPEAAGRYTLVVKMASGAGAFVAATWAGSANGPARAAAAAAPSADAPRGNCESPIPLAVGTTTGSTRRGDADHTGGCASSESRELVYKLEVARRGRVTIEVDPQFDSVLYVRKEECAEAEAEVACNDDASGSPAGNGHRSTASRGSRLDEVLDAGTYYVFVDGYGSEAGNFRMTVQVADVPTLADACQRMSPLGGGPTQGTLANGFDHARSSCGADAKGPDVVHRLDVPQRARVRITERSGDFSPVVHVRRRCADDHSEAACSDSGAAAAEATWAGVLEPGSYAVFADASDKDASGRYTLRADIAPESGTGVQGDACGDAIVLGTSERKVQGDTFEAKDDLAGKCGGAGAPDVVYRFDLPRRSRVQARFDRQEGEHAFVLMRSCADRSSELACGPKIDETLAPGSYFLAVDGTRADQLGRFSFDWRVRDVGAQEVACRAPPALVPGKTVTGTTAGAGDKFAASCAGREDGQSSADRVYAITLGARTRVRLALTTPTWDGVLALRRSCLDPPGTKTAREVEVACNNDFQDSRHSRIDTTLEPGTYFVVVDGHQAGNEGAFTLEYTQPR
jgi:hypothetical protein